MYGTSMEKVVILIRSHADYTVKVLYRTYSDDQATVDSKNIRCIQYMHMYIKIPDNMFRYIFRLQKLRYIVAFRPSRNSG